MLRERTQNTRHISPHNQRITVTQPYKYKSECSKQRLWKKSGGAGFGQKQLNMIIIRLIEIADLIII